MVNNPPEPPTIVRRMPDSRTSDLYGNLPSNGLISTSGPSSVMPPPVPPRPPPSSNTYNNWTMNNSNSYGYSPYGSFNTNPYYGSGNYYYGGQNYGGFGAGRPYYDYHNGGGESDFMRLAEQNTRNVFQSAESVVYAFNSVSQMFESTLNAFYSSFRAVLGVADQFTRLKMHMQNIFATLALFRFCRWLWRRFLVFLRFRPPAFAEQAWNAGGDLATAADILPSFGGSVGAAKPSTNWPLLAFFAVAIGGPMLIYKLMAKLMSSVEESRKWATGQAEHYSAVVLYDFVAGSQQEISIQAGQQLRLAPKDLQPQVKGWLLGSVDGKQVGLVPANYIRVMGRRSGGGGVPSDVSKADNSNNISIAPSASSAMLTSTSEAKVPNFDDIYENSF